MNSTKRFSKIISLYLIVTGLGFLLSGDFYSKMISHTGSDPVLINLSGMVHFFIGMSILTEHFLWKKPLQIVVTLLGFMFLLKGSLLIAIPELILQTNNNPVQAPAIMSLGFLGGGLLLGYFGYIKKQK